MKKKSMTVKKILSRIGFIIIILALWELVYLLGVEVLGCGSHTQYLLLRVFGIDVWICSRLITLE